MKRISKVTLKYTKEELIQKLYISITEAENISIESMNFDGEHFIFTGIDGQNNIPQETQLNKLNFDSIINPKIQKEKGERREYKMFGSKKVLEKILANGVICTLPMITQELNLKGIHVTETETRKYLIAKGTLYTECDPNKFQLREWFDKKFNK